jgi:predicted Zn-dependent peptidase
MSAYLPAAHQEPESTQVILREDSGSLVLRTVLDNGLRVITESMPGSRSVSFGVWVGAGSRDEEPEQHGAAHYLEHLLFKGTPRRSAFEVNAAIDAIGGEMNAFTSRETTCFYAHVLDADLPVAADVVMDVVTAALLRDADIEAERQVVLEEIAMHEDDPSDVAMEHCYSQVLADRALARPILGTRESIEALPADAIRGFYREHYRPQSLVVAAAGSLDHGLVVELVREALRPLDLATGVAPQPIRSAAVQHGAAAGDIIVRRPTEQAHMVVAGPSLPRNDPDKYALAVCNAVLGGGMSSRLFTRVREELGLAYSVYSFAAPFADTGLFGVYAGTRLPKAAEAVSVIRSELARAVADGFTDDEVRRGKGAIRGGRILSLEDPFARMGRLGQSELVVGELPTIDEIQQRIEAVTADDVARVAQRILPTATSLTLVGAVPEGWSAPSP